MAGTPATMQPAGTSLVTTAPEAITALLPTVTPGLRMAPGPHPDVVPDKDRLAKLQPRPALSRVQGVGGGQNHGPGAEEAIVPDFNGADIQKHTVVVGVKPVAHPDVAAVIAMEVRLHPGVVSTAAQKLLEEGLALPTIQGVVSWWHSSLARRRSSASSGVCGIIHPPPASTFSH